MLAIKVSISNLIVTCPGPPGWAGTRQVKSGRLKPIWIYWSKRQWVAVASAGLCNAYSLRPPTRSPLRATHEFTSHSTHPQSSSLHGAVKAESHSEIEKRAVPPPCFLSFNYQSTRSRSYTRAGATSAYVGLTVHWARSDAYHHNLTGWWTSR